MDLVERILDSVDSSGGGWPVLVLVIVIGVIAYLVSRWMDRQSKITEQRITDRKLEFEAQLARERLNTESHKNFGENLLTVVQDNTKAITEFSGTQRLLADSVQQNTHVLSELSGIQRTTSETLTRLDRHLEQSTVYRQRSKPRSEADL